MILASKSPRRLEILKEFGFDIKVVSKEIEEVSDEKIPINWVIDVARKKAEEVAMDYSDEWVVGADTIVLLENEMLGKPLDDKDAFSVLKKLSGRYHEVITGVALINKKLDIEVTFADSTEVYFKEISNDEIEWYIKTGEPMDKAGSYGIQGKGSVFIDKIIGDFFNVMGFPISKFYDKLKELKINTKELYKL